MTADGRRRASAPGVFESPKALAPGVSKRSSRGFFSLFSSSKGQPQPLALAQPPQVMNGKLQRPRSSFPSNQSLQAFPERFDAISLTSPLQRDDPAFSRNPNAHPFMFAPPKDAIRTSRPAPEPAPRLIGPVVNSNLGPVASQQQRFAELQENNRKNEANYSQASTSESSFTVPSSSSSSVSGHSSMKSPSSSSSHSRDESRIITPTRIFPPQSETREDSPVMVASAVVEKDHQLVDLKDRPLSPPPEYELMASPHEMLAFELPDTRPEPLRNDSAPELHRIEPPVLPHRSATTPNLGSAPPASGSRRATNDRKQQAYDLDRIDELDESNPLGVALHHEGPFQAIASVLKGPQPQPSPPQMRAPRTPKPPGIGGSFSPGQVLPPNFAYLYHQPHRQDYGSSPQASTSYIPPPQSQFGRPSQSQFGQPPRSEFGQPQYGQSNMRAPPHAQERPNQNPRWSQTHPHQPPPPLHTTHPSPPAQLPHSHPYNLPASYIQTQYDPVDAPAQLQTPVHTGHSYYPESYLHPPNHGHLATYSSEDNSDAYGGMEEDPTPNQERSSIPPRPTASQMEPHYAPPQHGDPNNSFSTRRHTVQTGYGPDLSAFPDTARQSSNIRHSHNPNGQPVAGVLDPRIFQNHGQLDAGQNSSGMRHSPNPNGQPIVAHRQAFPTPQAVGPVPNEQDRRTPSSYQPQPTGYSNHGFTQRPMEQYPPPVAEHHLPRRASYQPVQAPRLPPADLARIEFERNQYRQQQLMALAQDRPQSVISPSVATTTNPLRRLPPHTPKHLVMPTPLQQSSPLPTSNHSAPNAYPNGHYESPNSSQTRLPLQQAQPTRAQTIQMDGNRHFLKKRMSAVQPAAPPAPVMPPKTPLTRPYMEPPPTVPEPSIIRSTQHKEKRPKRLLSKRRSDL
ncbi:hypothetical protein B0H12DRAFT_1086322 [Mycena haematopus]|nr:hypothetical protein B0H12DRAFT_1086322 [Mycena haematopus]